VTYQIPDGHFLVSYDYGMGGFWWFVKADSADEIRRASSDLTVHDSVPDWMRHDHWSVIQSDDLLVPKNEALRMILTGQT
jgi:hypothetical protein